MSKYTVEGYWDCPYCRTTKIKGRTEVCPGCNRRRGKETEFYLVETSEGFAIEHEKIGPDWFCDFCESYNSAKTNKCQSCGSTRVKENKSYFDINDKTNDYLREKRIAKRKPDPMSLNHFHKSSEENTYRKSTEEDIYKKDPEEKDFKATYNIDIKKFLKPTLFIILVVALISFIVNMFSPKTVIVEDKLWEREIMVESYNTVRESDWTLPKNARLISKKEEIHHYNQVFSHYETRTREVSESVFDGYDTYTTTRDNGDGTFDIGNHQTPRYRTEYRTESYEEPVYNSVPEFRTKYYYDIEKWEFNRKVISKGKNNQKPAWGILKLSTGNKTLLNGQEKLLGQERESQRIEKYFLKDFDGKTYEVDKEVWNKIKPETKIKIKKSFGGFSKDEVLSYE